MWPRPLAHLGLLNSWLAAASRVIGSEGKTKTAQLWSHRCNAKKCQNEMMMLWRVSVPMSATACTVLTVLNLYHLAVVPAQISARTTRKKERWPMSTELLTVRTLPMKAASSSALIVVLKHTEMENQMSLVPSMMPTWINGRSATCRSLPNLV